ncbi:MAG: ATP-binding cassette domain-containing protein [Sneathiella sp.]
MMLSLENIDVSIQSVPILRQLSLNVGKGELVGLVGRNGAGKTTTMRSIMGLNRPTGGTIHFNGTDISSYDAHKRPALGIGYMPEDRRLVPELTVEENMLLPAWANSDLDSEKSLKFIYDLIPEVHEMRDRKSLLLSGGQQKLVALGRALVAGTKILLLDEPFEGVAPVLTQRLMEVISALRKENRSILIAQSELMHSVSLLDREFVIERGEIISEGSETSRAGTKSAEPNR